MMRRCRITVLANTFNKEIAAEYGVPGIGPCQAMQPGMVFETHFTKPDGFCDDAWSAIHQYVFTLAHGKGVSFYEDNWVKQPDTAICSCNDGLRPVIFKIEAINE